MAKKTIQQQYDEHFNSIKVRLEHTYSNDAVISFKFQFHKGAIRTNLDRRNLFTAKIFQFHKGAIRTHLLIL